MKVGDVVEHRTFGTGRVLEIRKAGLQAKIYFRRGFFNLCDTKNLQIVEESPIAQSERQQDKSSQSTMPPAGPLNIIEVDNPEPHFDVPAQTIQPVSLPDRPLVSEKFLSKQTIEALRLGVVPHSNINELTVGLSLEQKSIRDAFATVEKLGGDARAVVGEYGTGKSHLLEWIAAEALKQNYVVASASLNLLDVPPYKPKQIYNALVRSLRYPGRTDGGSLGPLFDHLLGKDFSQRRLSQILISKEGCPLFTALNAYAKCRRSGELEGAEILLQWIGGEKFFPQQIRTVTGRPVPTMRTPGNSADLYCYLLGGIGSLARWAGYKGLVVLLDEAEHHGLLTYIRKDYADNFFKGMIYAALGDQQTRIKGCANRHGLNCGLMHNPIHPYRFRYAPKSHLLFIFAGTPSAISHEYPSWLQKNKILQLRKALSPGEIETLLAQIYVYHNKAYGNGRKDAYVDTSAKLIDRYENGRINLRELIRSSTEVFDLLHTYPDYSAALIAKEIDRAFA